ncbi:Ribosomal L18p/L5e family protein [Striga hermonthica]|uniref:Ribosomal L18p/L5e family protein n=1 Tax=Striga hermonthica TaxID=68872 RepID=A0A9N7N0W5_STRHE|nr:Ribosomal L18p/L5e family protein [Striga hermonthica]
MVIGSCFLGLKIQACGNLGTGLNRSSISPMSSANVLVKPLVIQARANQRTESPKIRNRRLREKEAAKRVGEELIKMCVDLNINEISSYDRNGLACGERMQAFEIAIYSHGFLHR